MILKKIEKQFISTLSIDQHAYIPKRSTVTNMIDFISFVLDAFESHNQVDVTYTDVTKAFDLIEHNHKYYMTICRFLNFETLLRDIQ